MCAVRRLSIIDQTMEHIRHGVREGRWSGRLPGIRPLSKELGVSRETLRTALRRLEQEGLLGDGGVSGARRILGNAAPVERGVMRIALLPMLPPKALDMYTQSFLWQLMHDLEAAGHSTTLVYPPGDSREPSAAALARLVREKPADAWIVHMGAQSTLRWFSGQNFPVMALDGRASDLPMAATGVDYEPAIRDATRELLRLGHRRIVYVCPHHARHPGPGPLVKAFLQELTAAGVPAGAYNIPDWEESPTGFRRLLESLFKLTPPTALILRNGLQVSGAISFFADRHLRIPEDVSVLAQLSDDSVSWQKPVMGVADFSREDAKITRHIVRWADDAARGKSEKEQVHFPSRFTPSHTVGPAPKARSAQHP